jgi:hypothetical protein
MSDARMNGVTFTVKWDMSPERLAREGYFWLLPRDHPQHPLAGMSKRQVRRWRKRRMEVAQHPAQNP